MTVTMNPSPRPDAAATGFHVTSLVVYPVKSARGIALAEADVGPRGITHDRRFMIVDASGRFVSQREYPRLALLPTSIDSGAVTLGPVRLPEVPTGPTRRVTIWGDEVDAVSVGGEVDAFLRGLLGAEVALVYMAEASVRPVDPAYGRPGDETSFADGFPLLVIGEASLADLEARLSEPVPMNRFRPNIVVASARPDARCASAHAEDTWSHILIGDLPMRIVKPCGRCMIPTIDQDTGVAGMEPLRTLAGYRKIDGKVLFGQNAIPDRSGTIRVGDPVSLI